MKYIMTKESFEGKEFNLDDYGISLKNLKKHFPNWSADEYGIYINVFYKQYPNYDNDGIQICFDADEEDVIIKLQKDGDEDYYYSCVINDYIEFEEDIIETAVFLLTKFKQPFDEYVKHMEEIGEPIDTEKFKKHRKELDEYNKYGINKLNEKFGVENHQSNYKQWKDKDKLIAITQNEYDNGFTLRHEQQYGILRTSFKENNFDDFFNKLDETIEKLRLESNLGKYKI